MIFNCNAAVDQLTFKYDDTVIDITENYKYLGALYSCHNNTNNNNLTYAQSGANEPVYTIL